MTFPEARWNTLTKRIQTAIDAWHATSSQKGLHLIAPIAKQLATLQARPDCPLHYLPSDHPNHTPKEV